MTLVVCSLFSLVAAPLRCTLFPLSPYPATASRATVSPATTDTLPITGPAGISGQYAFASRDSRDTNDENDVVRARRARGAAKTARWRERRRAGVPAVKQRQPGVLAAMAAAPAQVQATYTYLEKESVREYKRRTQNAITAALTASATSAVAAISDATTRPAPLLPSAAVTLSSMPAHVIVYAMSSVNAFHAGSRAIATNVNDGFLLLRRPLTPPWFPWTSTCFPFFSQLAPSQPDEPSTVAVAAAAAAAAISASVPNVLPAPVAPVTVRCRPIAYGMECLLDTQQRL
jgi:hypothetical protein